MAINQTQNSDLLQIIIKMCAGIVRIPIIIMIIIAACCIGFTGIVLCIRVTGWVFSRFLANPW
ncbi:MAG: hypothetical protein A2Y10_05945 [Planctomycetes bacterium GWF2_41_51]|nr:MAG: hypothetical protein A2Y10_05945 [Planctomycetes bacterium GWF2_41_51]